MVFMPVDQGYGYIPVVFKPLGQFFRRQHPRVTGRPKSRYAVPFLFLLQPLYGFAWFSHSFIFRFFGIIMRFRPLQIKKAAGKRESPRRKGKFQNTLKLPGKEVVFGKQVFHRRKAETG